MDCAFESFRPGDRISLGLLFGGPERDVFYNYDVDRGY
jgi:hypothetical protein